MYATNDAGNAWKAQGGDIEDENADDIPNFTAEREQEINDIRNQLESCTDSLKIAEKTLEEERKARERIQAKLDFAQDIILNLKRNS